MEKRWSVDNTLYSHIALKLILRPIKYQYSCGKKTEDVNAVFLREAEHAVDTHR